MKKPLIVQKFGGTSVGSIERIQHVAEQIIREKKAGSQLVVVVSAMSGETNRLLNLAKQIDSVPNARELDALLSTGEQVSMALLSMTLSKLGYRAISLTGSQAQIQTNNQHNNATISDINPQVIKQYLNDDQIVIVAGFQGVNERNDVTTLGRGGSDTTAVTLAGILGANECQIYTDVDGIYTGDPRVVNKAQRLESINFPAMTEMSRKGAKVLHLPCVEYAWQHQVPLRVLSSFQPGKGTLVQGDEQTSGILGIAVQKQLLSLTVPQRNKQHIVQQSMLCGVEIECWVEKAEHCALIIKEEAFDKITSLLDGLVIKKQEVGLVSVVGQVMSSFSSQSQQLLNLAEISVLHFCEDKHSFTLVIESGTIDKATNVLHDNYIIPNEMVSREEKLVCLG
ncbi:aspartate kinase [Vibrio sp. 10N.286.49.C2]|uniref:aspartate kinase n=1 Tax=unclassified Vibrio TaxID=2614977 RepID=UPI000C8336ED|nr:MULTISPECIES: aspartate kinase [unclassified Vibrio]PMH29414.1 aspartate kinase [Vibrio sp. 10N.286.49.C2]PMH46112.1 aspartate kinase [Vibrio sp. 10N.286.49.B1]PMH81126.1 aspartate kinase [Vibrio sp. 10N.286.48.B7]